VARRPVLMGLAVVAAAGLAGAGWELTRGGAPRPAASGVKRGRATSPAPQASAPRSTPAPHTGTKLWSFATGGLMTAIALDSGTVFAGGQDGNVYALRASDGRRLWTFNTGDRIQSKIAAADGVIYAGNEGGKVYALRASDGSEFWSFVTEGPVESQIAVSGRTAYVGSNDGKVYALTG